VVASMNLSNLVLARGIVRQRELAVRLALGASRWRLVREQLAESTLLALIGGLASWLVLQSLRWVLDIELPVGGRFTLTLQPTLNLAALTTASVALLLSLLVFGLEPALQLTRGRRLRNDLAAGAGSVGAPRAERQRALLRWQVAISAGFFIIATLFIRHTIAEMRHDTGIEMDRLAVAVLSFDTQRWDETRVRRVLGRAMEEAGQERSVEAVAVSTGLPVGVAGQMSIGIGKPDNAADPNRLMPAAAIAASPSLFRAIGVPIVRGRGFDDRDHAGAAAVVVLTERTARKLFGTIDAASRRILVQRQRMRTTQPPITATVIGVARDTDTGHVFGNRGDLVYLPFSQHYDASMTLTARSTGDLALAVRAVRGAIRRADPDLAVEASGTGRAMLAGPYVFLRGAGLGALSLGALTLLLAMVGLFGIQSHMVAQRTREIGVRMSFGATAVNIRRMVLKDGYAPVFQGLAIGVFIGLSGRAIVRSYLDVNVSVVDPWMLLVVPIPLLLAAFCACYLPAHRASRVDPNVALRHL
jgi:predicted permease